MDNVDYAIIERKGIQRLALESKRRNGVPDPEQQPAKDLIPKLDAFLTWLEALPKIDPQLKTRSKIDEGLALIFKNPLFHFSAVHQKRAQDLHNRFEADNWGVQVPTATAANLLRASGSEEDGADAERPTKRRKSSPTRDITIKPVPPDHRIWGLNGIMHGLARRSGARKTNVLNPRYKNEQRDARRHGHNGATVGDWFPYQLAALFHGVHGSSQAGIHHGGDTSAGAYSIVVAAHYDELDIDRGDRLWYSGSGSSANTDPNEVPPQTHGTSALHRSMDTRTAVRVLRSASGKSRFAPSRGIRYDGLYRVVACREKQNANGGLFEQFELERLPNQLSLDDCKKRPNGAEVRDFDMVDRGY